MGSLWKERALLVCLAFALDTLLGDPQTGWHPVCLMGRLISFLEKALRRIFPGTKTWELIAGAILAILCPFASCALAALILWTAGRISPLLSFFLQLVLCYFFLAARSLQKESMVVCRRLEEGDKEGARAAVSRIVGRDTARLDEQGIARAAVETVAENASDGVIAPLLYMAAGGPVLGAFYKAVNTMDSMVAYKNDRYLYFGRAAARLDDLANFLPARITAGLLIISAALLGLLDPHYSARRAAAVFIRDRYKHASPNSAQPESAAAGALGLRLAGDAWYFGSLYKKPFIGDPVRPVSPADIRRMNRLMYGAALLCLALCEGLCLAGAWAFS